MKRYLKIFVCWNGAVALGTWGLVLLGDINLMLPMVLTAVLCAILVPLVILKGLSN